tara:strand:+ start:853 stop:3939 length:3087 start_codon:yes stop_codon:yes gene_type:complete
MKFKKSKYGQWEFPGENTLIPNVGGSITMKGVNYPVLGIDDEGNQQMMMPGYDYQFPGNSVYEIPMYDNGGNVSWNFKGKTYSGTLIPSMETDKARYARTHNGNIKTLPKRNLGGSLEFIDVELTEKEADEYAKGGYILEELNEGGELPKAQFGIPGVIDMQSIPKPEEPKPDKNLLDGANESLTNWADENRKDILRGLGEWTGWYPHSKYNKIYFDVEDYNKREDEKRRKRIFKEATKKGVSSPCNEGMIYDHQTKNCISEEEYFEKYPRTEKINKAIKEANESFPKDVQWFRDYMNSPMYKQMLMQSMEADFEKDVADGKPRVSPQRGAQSIAEQRMFNLSNMPAPKYRQKMIHDQDTHEEIPDPDQPIAWIEHSGQVGHNPENLEHYGHSNIHEISHSTDISLENSGRLIPDSDIAYMDKAAAKKYYRSPAWYKRRKQFEDEGWFPEGVDTPRKQWQWYKKKYPDYVKRKERTMNYVERPTETRARLMEIRQVAQKAGIYDPFTQKVDKKAYKKLKRLKNPYDGERLDPMDQLKKSYSDEEIMWMLNNISKNEAPQVEGDDMQMAKEGMFLDIELTKDEAAEYAKGGYILEEMEEGERKKKGYRRVYEEDSGSTEFGERKVVDVYRPNRGVSKTLTKDITYKTEDTPRVKFTEREVTRRYKDGSIKSYKNIRRKNGKLIENASTKKVRYKKGERPHNTIELPKAQDGKAMQAYQDSLDAYNHGLSIYASTGFPFGLGNMDEGMFKARMKSMDETYSNKVPFNLEDPPDYIGKKGFIYDYAFPGNTPKEDIDAYLNFINMGNRLKGTGLWGAKVKPIGYWSHIYDGDYSLGPLYKKPTPPKFVTKTLTRIEKEIKPTYKEAYKNVDKDMYPTLQDFIYAAKYYDKYKRNPKPEDLPSYKAKETFNNSANELKESVRQLNDLDLSLNIEPIPIPQSNLKLSEIEYEDDDLDMSTPKELRQEKRRLRRLKRKKKKNKSKTLNRRLQSKGKRRKREEGGSVNHELGDIVNIDKAAKEQLEKLGYTLKEI